MKKFLVILLAIFLISCTTQPDPPETDDQIETPTPTQQATATSTPTPFPCPAATPEPLWVEPVQSPTNLLTQTIVIKAGNSERVEVDTGFDSYSMSGNFDSFNNPAEVEITLMAGQTHQLTVSSRVKEVMQGDCSYGGYTLSTTFDRNGDPLEIIQEGE